MCFVYYSSAVTKVNVPYSNRLILSYSGQKLLVTTKIKIINLQSVSIVTKLLFESIVNKIQRHFVGVKRNQYLILVS